MIAFVKSPIKKLQLVKTIKFEDVLIIHKNFKQVEKTVPCNSKRNNYFLAAFLHSNPNIDLQNASKLCPHCGLFEINNSSWEDRLKNSNFVRLHSVLHDAAGFVQYNSEIGPGYTYNLQCPINNCYLGHVSGIFFCYFLDPNRVDNFRLLEY